MSRTKSGVRPIEHNTVETPSRYNVFHVCERKRSFKTKEAADAAMESLKQAPYYKSSAASLEVYQCIYCHEFHFGHQKGK